MNDRGDPRWLLSGTNPSLRAFKRYPRPVKTPQHASDINPVKRESLPKRKSMPSRNPQLDGNLPPVSRREWAELENEVAEESHHKWQQVVRPVPLEQQQGVNVDKIRRRQVLLPDLRREELPYDVEEYISLDREVTLLYSKRFEAMQVCEGETAVVRVPGCEQLVKFRKECWWARWKYLKNTAKK